MMVRNFAAFVFFFAQSALAQDLAWNFNGQAGFTGELCDPAGDSLESSFLAAGDEVALVLPSGGVVLDSGSDQLSARGTCAIRVPLKVAAGRYISALDASMGYILNKTSGTKASVSFRAAWAAFEASDKTESFDVGERVSKKKMLLSVRNDLSKSKAEQCAGAQEGILKFNLAVNLTRSSESEKVWFAPIDGEDFVLDVSPRVASCR